MILRPETKKKIKKGKTRRASRVRSNFFGNSKIFAASSSIYSRLYINHLVYGLGHRECRRKKSVASNNRMLFNFLFLSTTGAAASFRLRGTSPNQVKYRMERQLGMVYS